MGDLRFVKCSRVAGREIVFRRGKIVGDIVPSSTGFGGWVTAFDRSPDRKGMPSAEYVRTRADARAIFEIEPVVPTTPARSASAPRNARNPQAAEAYVSRT